MERPFQAYEGSGPYVFVCYAHADAESVYPEIARLRDAGVNIWYDEGIAPGSEWSETLAARISGCSVFLYFVTPRSVASEHCRHEINFAVEEHRKLVAAHLEPTEVPPGLRLTLNARQAILRYDQPRERYETKLASALTATKADSPTPPSPPPAATQPHADEQHPGHRWKIATAFALAVAFAAGWWTLNQHGAPPADPSTVAVLTFQDLTPDESLGWLAEGLTFELNNQISQAASLLGVTTVPRALLAGRGASDVPEHTDLIVTGNVQEGPDLITVNVEVIETPGGTTVWADSFSGRREDPLGLQNRISAEIARYFHEVLIGTGAVTKWPASGPTAPDARTAYFQHLREDVAGRPDQALYWLERTLELDPTWARGWVRLGEMTQREVVRRTGGITGREPDAALSLARARDAFAKARELGLEDDPGQLISEVEFLYITGGDLGVAEQKLRATASVFAGGYARLMLLSGLTEEAERVLSPLAERGWWMPFVWDWLAQARAASGDLEGAYQAARKIESLVTSTYADSIIFAYLLPMTGRLDEARRFLEQLSELPQDGSDPATTLIPHLAFWIAFAENDFATATQVAEAVQSSGDYNATAHWLLLLGDPRAAESFAIAETTYPRSAVGMSRMTIHGALREDPAYRKFLESLGFTREWRLEMCRRAASMPPETHISCDPSEYALDLRNAAR